MSLESDHEVTHCSGKVCQEGIQIDCYVLRSLTPHLVKLLHDLFDQYLLEISCFLVFNMCYPLKKYVLLNSVNLKRFICVCGVSTQPR